ncbi:putative ATPase PWA37_005339 [Arxiozyma heterogenica]|uniref:putative ATPase n=1 Tax=Arxiozyma heterogenica TaxID=278026 RepID=UPI002F1F5471
MVVTRSLRSQSPQYLQKNKNKAVRYTEKEENDFTPDILVDSSDNEDSNLSGDDEDQEHTPIWLTDGISEDSDIALESDVEDQDDLILKGLLNDKNGGSASTLNSTDKNKGNGDGDDNDGDGGTDNNDDDETDEMTISLKLKKLDEFVKQSQVYSSIIADTLLKRTEELQEERNEELLREKDKQTTVTENGSTDTADIKQPPKKKQKKSITDYFKSITDYFTSTNKSKEDGKLSGSNSRTSKEDKDDLLNSIESIRSQQPGLLENCILKPYQLEGLNWLVTLYENGLNGILADEMGLGKTIQSIALLAFIYEMDTKGPFLIAAPLSTLDNWMNELAKFAPSIPVCKYYSTKGKKSRMQILKNFFKKNKYTGIVVTSYEIIMRDSNYIMSKEWKFLIVDEGHRLKNINSKLIKELKRINTSNRLLLTGTPLQNNLAELWSLLNFIMPDIFADFEIFNKWFDFKDFDLQSNSKKLNKVINDELEKNLITNLHTILKPFLLRRLKRTVLANILPPKREYIVNCPLTPIQKKFYQNTLKSNLRVTIFKELVKHFFTLNKDRIGYVSNKSIRQFINFKLRQQSDAVTPLLEVDGDDPSNTIFEMDKLYQKYLHQEILNKRTQSVMMQLRQIVDSTFLFYFPYLEPEEMTLEVLLQTSGKLQILQQLVIPLVKSGHKVLIFSQFYNMLDLLEDWCELNSLKSLRIDGSVDNETRKEEISKFNSTKDKHNVFLLSTRAAGLGINLVAADSVILFDSDWNPQVDLQAMDRCHRIGQDKPVIVYRLCCDNTIEHLILTRAANKRKLERLVIQMGRFNTLKKLALNEGSFLTQSAGIKPKSTNKELVTELSELLMSGSSSIGFRKETDEESERQDLLTEEELKELMDRSSYAYKVDRTINMPHITLFETTSQY